jgi:hypothetical protein
MSVNNIVTGLATLSPLVRGADDAFRGGNLSAERVAKTALRSFYDAALYFGAAFAGGWIATQLLNFGAKLLSFSPNLLLAKIGVVATQVLLLGLITWGVNAAIRAVCRQLKIDPAIVIG